MSWIEPLALALRRDLFPLLWTGLVTGCLYSLGALGLVMIFKSSKVVNFAHGNVAALAAFLVYGFTAGALHLSWWTAVALSFAVVVAVALASYGTVAPVVFKSDLTGTIATLGISLVLQGATQLGFGSDIVNMDLPTPRWAANLGGLRVTAYDVAVLVTAFAMVGLLFLVIDRTKLGVAFRAVSGNAFASQVCGLDLRRVHLFSWIASAMLGIVAALLIVPTTFLSSTTVASFMLQAFAAAVIGGFDSLPGSAIGGILVGILVNVFTFAVSPEFTNTFLLVIILVALNVFPRGILAARSGARV